MTGNTSNLNSHTPPPAFGAAGGGALVVLSIGLRVAPVLGVGGVLLAMGGTVTSGDNISFAANQS
jgi:hypothetical protein